MSLKPTDTVSEDFKYKEVLFREQNTVSVSLLSLTAVTADLCTVLVLRMADRKWKEIKQQPSMLPGPSVPGCSLDSFHFLWAILCPQPQAVDFFHGGSYKRY